MYFILAIASSNVYVYILHQFSSKELTHGKVHFVRVCLLLQPHQPHPKGNIKDDGDHQDLHSVVGDESTIRFEHTTYLVFHPVVNFVQRRHPVGDLES